VVDFVFAAIELFASSYGSDVISRYWSKSALFKGERVSLAAKFQVEGDVAVGVRKVEGMIALSYNIKILAKCSFVSSQSTHMTEGQTRTDRQNCNPQYRPC